MQLTLSGSSRRDNRFATKPSDLLVLRVSRIRARDSSDCERVLRAVQIGSRITMETCTSLYTQTTFNKRDSQGHPLQLALLRYELQARSKDYR